MAECHVVPTRLQTSQENIFSLYIYIYKWGCYVDCVGYFLLHVYCSTGVMHLTNPVTKIMICGWQMVYGVQVHIFCELSSCLDLRLVKELVFLENTTGSG